MRAGGNHGGNDSEKSSPMAALDGMEVGEDGDGWPNSNGLGVWALPDEMSTGDEVIEKLQEDRKSEKRSQKKNLLTKKRKIFV